MFATAAPAQLTIFHRPDDPWSLLLLQCLPRLAACYDVSLRFVTVPLPGPEFAPRPDALMANGLRDAVDLCRHLALDFPAAAQAPSADEAFLAARILLARRDAASYLSTALTIGAALFGPRDPAQATLARAEKTIALPDPDTARAQLAENGAAQQAMGHYHSAMIHFEGGWYWGVDRLWHLENVLINRGFRRGTGVPGVVPRRAEPIRTPLALPPEGEPELRFYCSFRSPYAYLAAARTFALARRYRLRVSPRLIIPMKMAGFAIPKIKADYFRTDCAREGLRHGVDFGHFTDPYGPGLRRAMAIFPHAQAQGRAEDYILSAMRGVWVDGLDLAEDAALSIITARAGIDPDDAIRHAAPDADLSWADRHRDELARYDQYAAPVFVIGDYMTWGQDRLWMLDSVLQHALERRP
ncbi:MAG: 2-hydroxychromene-2-carboxylate isomerase [Rhodobacteraceae bacterium HLUCCA12]|nr:MAG: 2-hydroxychromene-2-carboxylate isomerase [Rhodobacteraceae bacterium HLUCCA12]